MKRTPSPCKGACPRRSPTCHTDCPEYLQYWKDNEERRASYYKWLETMEYGFDRGRKIQKITLRAKRR